MNKRSLILSTLVGTLCLSSYWLGTAYAHGVPSAALVYSGTLLQDGSRPSGTTNVTVSLYDMATAGARVCAASDPVAVDLATGRFSATLGSDCRAAIQGHADVYVQVAIVGAAAATWPARSALQPVPYALEAESASSLHQSTANWCGLTASVAGNPTSGALTGYHAIQAMCSAACGASPTAHACTSAELVINNQIGDWYTRWPAGTTAWYAGGAGIPSGGVYWNDCGGFTSNSTTVHGQAWDGAPNEHTCNESHPIICCD